MASHETSSSIDPNRRNHPAAAASVVTLAAVSPNPTSPKLDPITPLSDSDKLSKSHPPSPKMVGPRTVQMVAKKPNEAPQEHSTTEKFNDSEEKFERMINCITAKEREMKQLLKEHEHLTRRLSVSLSSSRSGRRRRSICGSQIELADVFANNGVKVVSADMPPFMQIHAVDCARKAHDSMEKFTSKSLALTLKKEFDGVYGPAWHCIVGKSFGSFVTHSVGGFLYFSMAQKLYILLFKTTVQRAN
ncbi:uncharacterized protein LOC111780277 [Cucurbita pepo subsp. pepo]|uniref:uncharacterized protein LOC111780277 n=1 Tax=Cucurbita pepo subsp. pepo TaxID=3664 RepID=UPI000C9D8500|nr:uncharacterized protein LOC111780277 [Cucurbita pepo subsp. pepo]